MNVYSLNITSKNSYDTVKAFLAVYSALEGEANKSLKLRPKLLEILTYYILYGYNDDTKGIILSSIQNMNMYNLNQNNSELQRKGFLIKDKMLSKVKHLNPTLEKIRSYLKSEDVDKAMFIKFTNDAAR